MSEHEARIAWRATDAPFTYETFVRDHDAALTGVVVPVSAAAAYRGNEARTNPEELLVAAAASCHMMTFLAIAARKRLVVLEYDDRAVGHLEPDAEKRLAVTRIELRPRIVFAEPAPDAESLEKLHELAHRNCFIAQSIRATVTVLPADPSRA